MSKKGNAKLIKPKKEFTQVPNNLLDNKLLTWRAKGLFCYLMGKPDNWEFRVDNIINSGKEGRDAVRAALKELEKVGYLIRKAAKSETGAFNGWEWYLYNYPTGPPGNPSDGKPVRRETRPTESQGEFNNNVHSNNICNKKQQQQEENVAVVFLESINNTLANKTTLDFNTKSKELISNLMSLKSEELGRFIKNFKASSANWGFLIQNPEKLEDFLKEKPKKEYKGSFCQTTGQEFEIFGG